MYDQGAVFTAELVGVTPGKKLGEQFVYCVVLMGMVRHVPERYWFRRVGLAGAW